MLVSVVAALVGDSVLVSLEAVIRPVPTVKSQQTQHAHGANQLLVLYPAQKRWHLN